MAKAVSGVFYLRWVYYNNADNSCRYVFGTVGEHPLICVGVNPSTAKPNALDKTTNAVSRLARQNGYDSWIMINLYPQIATKPDDMDWECNNQYINTNFLHIENLLSKHPNSAIWAAWGTLIDKRGYLRDSMKEINTIAAKYNCKWITFGNRSKDGHPRHPLYLKATSAKNEFDVLKYQDAVQS